jgi:hypothetical protein
MNSVSMDMARLSNLHVQTNPCVNSAVRTCYEHNKAEHPDRKSVTGSQEPPQQSQRYFEVSWKPPSASEEQHGCDGQLGQVTLPAIVEK